MSFSTKYFSGPVSGTYDTLTTSGTFSAAITGNANGSLSGSWSFSGTYVDTYPSAPTSGNKSLSGNLTGTQSGSSLWYINWHNSDIITTGASLTLTNGQYSLNVGMSYYVDFEVTNSAGVWPYRDLFEFSSTVGTYVLPPVISIDTYTGRVAEDAGSITITLARSGAELGEASSVTLTTSNGAASSGSDYTAVNQVVTFASGEKSITVTLNNVITDDVVSEANENFYIALSSPVNGSLGFSSGTVTIVDNDNNSTDVAVKRVGGAGNDTLTGAAGNDTLYGGGGKNKMAGGAGDDTYYVSSKSDAVTEKASEGTDTVVSSISYSLGKEIENLTLADGAGNISGTGNTGNNTVTGNESDNTLYGKEGNDTLTGGSGNDVFAFDAKLSASTNIDLITDFVSGSDSINLSKKIFTAYKKAGVDLSNDFVSGVSPAAHDSSDHFLYDTATGALSYDADGSGATAAVQFATLVGAPTLVASDLHIY